MITNKINISNIIDARRLDVSYFLNVKHFGDYVPLSKYVEIKGGKRVPKGESFAYDETDNLYLRLSDIDNFESLNYGDFKYINDQLYQTLSRYEIKEGELAISIAGTIGKLFIVKDIPDGKKVILTENCAKILMRNADVSSEYIKILLSQDFVQGQINANRIKTTIPKLGLDRIGKLQIPVIPSVETQQHIIDLYNNAQDAKQAKEAEAKALLASIDSEILEQLNLPITNVANNFRLRHKIKVSELMANRYDPHQFHPERVNTVQNIIKSNKWRKLKDIVINVKSTTKTIAQTDIYIGLENIVSSTGEYCETSAKETVSSAAIFNTGNILFSKLRPYLNKVYKAEFNGVCSTEFHVFKAVNADADYLSVILRTKLILAQTKHLMTGNTLPRLQTADVENLIIPYPSSEIQKRIVNIVTTKKAKAKQLQQEGAAILSAAKAEVEKMILG